MNDEAGQSQQRGSMAPRVPPILPNRPHPDARKWQGQLFLNFGESYSAIEGRVTPFRVIEALLKRPGQITYEIMQGDSCRVNLTLLAAISLCMMAYGLLMGSFSGGQQLWVVPVKLWIGCLLSALLCLPSLYIFACLSGGKQSLAQICGLLLQGIALSAVLLIGFAPIAWIFSQSTDTVAFMGFLHLLFWLIGVYFGLSLLMSAIDYLNEERLHVLHVWGVIFILVACQMCTYLRPLVGTFDGFRLQDKQFFLANWLQTIGGN